MGLGSATTVAPAPAPAPATRTAAAALELAPVPPRVLPTPRVFPPPPVRPSPSAYTPTTRRRPPGQAGVRGGAADLSPVHRVPLAALLPADSPRHEPERAEHARLLAGTEAALPPIVVHRPTMRVIDGTHRLRAAALLGRSEIDVRYFDGPAEDAFVLAVEANVEHGLPLSHSERTAAARRILRSHPRWSDRAIASVVGLSSKTVAAYRHKLGGALAEVATRVGQDGRTRPLSSAEGRRIAGRLILESPEASLRVIARQAGISPGTVRDVRARMSRGEDVVPSRDRRRLDALAVSKQPQHPPRKQPQPPQQQPQPPQKQSPSQLQPHPHPHPHPYPSGDRAARASSEPERPSTTPRRPATVERPPVPGRPSAHTRPGPGSRAVAGRRVEAAAGPGTPFRARGARDRIAPARSTADAFARRRPGLVPYVRIPDAPVPSTLVPVPSDRPESARPVTGRSAADRTPPGPAVAETVDVFRSLCRDPSLRLTENGRQLLRMLELHLADPQCWDRAARSVPVHRAEAVSALALRCAEQWRQFAHEVNGAVDLPMA